MEFSVNNAECIKEYQKLGESVLVNICTGQETSIPWGIDLWFCIVLGISLIVMLIIFAITIYKGY